MMKKTRLASRSSVIRFASKIFPDTAGRNRGSGECATAYNALDAAFGVKPVGSQPLREPPGGVTVAWASVAVCHPR